MSYQHLARIAVLLFIVAPLVGCATGGKLRGQAMEVKSLNEDIHDRAYRCAPRELAFAESNVEFGLYELSQGSFVNARRHLTLAERNAKKADKMSDFDACRDQAVAVVVEKKETVEVKKIEPKPSDKDGDGILDKDDQCPLDPEDFDTFEDEDGCPDNDNDNDGIVDQADACMFVAEDVDSFVDDDGCPDLDNDGDGFADINDSCPDKAEDFDGFQDEDGCPDDDNDGDGIADVIDECPGEAEVYNNNKDEDGCPDKEALAQIDGDQIKLNQKVFFKTAKSDILPQSYPLLNEVATILSENASIRIRVEGHTDSRGSDSYNKKLSNERASSVRQYLMARGIDPGRIESIGFGEERPIDDNSTESGRANNRRVEIHITGR
jgi:outer membrane protein OmpA-like peptidoglycan-associated protein